MLSCCRALAVGATVLGLLGLGTSDALAAFPFRVPSANYSTPGYSNPSNYYTYYVPSQGAWYYNPRTNMYFGTSQGAWYYNPRTNMYFGVGDYPSYNTRPPDYSYTYPGYGVRYYPTTYSSYSSYGTYSYPTYGSSYPTYGYYYGSGY
jgi:hypothetical protein